MEVSLNQKVLILVLKSVWNHSSFEGQNLCKAKWGFQSIFKMTPFETRRDQDFIKQSLFANTLCDKSFINYFGTKSIFEEGSDSLLNRERPAKRIYSYPSHIWAPMDQVNTLASFK